MGAGTGVATSSITSSRFRSNNNSYNRHHSNKLKCNKRHNSSHHISSSRRKPHHIPMTHPIILFTTTISIYTGT